jgi:arylsulfatase B
MKTKNLWILGGLSLLSPVLAISSDKPNIILIVADDLGYGELGCQGNPQIPTPNIDAIANNGIRFTNGYVTASVCSPSRAALMTGKYQTRFGYEHNPLSAMNDDPTCGLPEGMITMAGMLQNAGYITGMFGKWHLGGTAKSFPLRRGFDEFFGFLHEGHYYLPSPYQGVTALLRRPVLPGGGVGRSPEGKLMYQTTSKAFEDPYDANNPIYRNGTPIDEKEYLTDAFAREAISFIDHNKENPFFIYLPFNAVHSPLMGADAYMSKFGYIEDIRRRIFAAMLGNLDDAVGRLIQKLREEGLEDNTLIIFLSDNGGPTEELTSSNLPLRGGKGNFYEGGIRIPFMMQWKKGLPAGKIYDKPLISLDIFATVAAVSGAEKKRIPELIDGVNLIPFLTGKNIEAPHEILYWRRGIAAALRNNNWKMVGNSKTGVFELFDLSNDISESKDLASIYPEKLKEMINLWDSWNSQNAKPLFGPARQTPDGRFIGPSSDK